MTELYLEDFTVGQSFGSGRLRIDQEQIRRFASDFDPQPFHLDDQAARASIFRGLAASGWHTAALPDAPSGRKRVQACRRHHRRRHRRVALAAPGASDDELRVESEVLEVRP